MTVDFKELLKKPADQVERPKPIPAGTYKGVVARQEFGQSKEKKTPYTRYHLTLTGPGDGVDPKDLDGIDLTKKQFRKDFYLTNDAEYRLLDFIASCGVNTKGRTLGELVPEPLGKDVLIDITQRNSEDGTEIYNDVGKVAGAA